jgi:uncharacterized protein
MDIFLLVLAVMLLIIGLAGCLLPVIPGPPVSFLALVTVHFTRFADFTVTFLLIMAFFAIAVTIVDLLVPVWASKKTGGSKYGMWGAAIGIIAGIFFLPPYGLIAGPVAGAIAGELLHGRKGKQALLAGLGSFAGFMLGIGLKLAVSLTITVYFIKGVM